MMLGALLVAALSSTVAWARSQVELLWPLSTVYPIAVRFIRVDRGCEILDKDPQSAYVVFACPDEPPPGGSAKDAVPRHGTLELIGYESTGKTRAQVTLNEEPRYMEMRFLELLERKIRDERGPVPPKPPAPPAAAPDGGH
jgi:hypothetical protein